MSIELHCGDCLDVMAGMEANSVDSVVTDPPYGLKFMGKDWDHGVPGIPFWREALRVAKPGAMLLAFGGTRTHPAPSRPRTSLCSWLLEIDRR